MPKPVFIICAKAGAEDKETGLISLFHVVEKLQITPLQVPSEIKAPMIVLSQSFRIVAVWMILPEEDRNQAYEYSMTIFGPPDGEPMAAGATGTFHFEKPLHRFTTNIEGLLPFKGSGTMVIESKIRKVGDTDWLSQNYPVLIEVVETLPPSQNTGSIPSSACL